MLFSRKHLLTRHSQDEVLRDYMNRIGNTPENEEGLHMFFSPNRIPIGLTDEEARACVALYPLRRAQVKRRTNPPELARISDPMQRVCAAARLSMAIPSLPPELSPHRRMTRRRFKKGIIKFLTQAAQSAA